MTREHLSGDNKTDVLRAVQDKLATLVISGFDGNIVISSRKGYLGKVRAVPREAQDVFDPREEIRQRRLLTED